MKRILFFIIATLLATRISAGETTVNIRHFSESDGLPQSVVTCVMQDSKGYIWLSSWNGLSRYDGYSFTHFKARQGDGCPLITNKILFIRETRDSNILCKSHEGYYVFNTKDKRFYALPKKKTDSGDRFRPSPQLESLVGSQPEYRNVEFRILGKDRQGGYWIYTNRGLDRLTFCRQKIAPTRFAGNGEEVIRAIFRDKDGRVFVADKNGMVRITDQKHNTWFLASDGSISKTRKVFGANIYSIYQDSRGYLWMGSKPKGLFRLESAKNGGFIVRNFISSPHNRYGINCNSIYAITEDKAGRIILGTYGGGLNIVANPWSDNPQFFNCNNVMKDRYPKDAKLIHDILMTRSGLLLLATYGGLCTTRLNANPGRMTFTQNKRMPSDKESIGSNQVMALLQARSGDVYVATYDGGLNIISRGDLGMGKMKFRALTTDNGMSSDVVLNLFENRAGHIWLVSEHSLMDFDPIKQSFTNYTESMFAGGFSFSEVRPLYNPLDETALFGTTQGIMPINDRLISKSRFVPRIVFDAPQRIELAPDEKNLSISFAALDFNKNEPIQYAYKLEGVDKDWLYTRENRINLSNIPAGTHRLVITSTNGDGVWVDNDTSLTICRTPYFNERPVAWMLYGALLIAFAFAVFKVARYTRRLEREIKELKLSSGERMEYLKVRLGDMMEGKEDAENAKNSDSIESSEFKSKVENFMKSHFSDPDLNVQSFAAEMGMSRSVLYIQMKKELGCTPNNFILDYRLNAAYSMLQNDRSLNVSEIAYRCGFSDPKYFSRCFKKAKGCTPSEIRS